MCYAIPAKILKLEGDNATVDYGGVKKTVNVTLINSVKIGDYVLIHAGFAIEKIDKVSAEDSLKIIRNDLAQFNEDDFIHEGRKLIDSIRQNELSSNEEEE